MDMRKEHAMLKQGGAWLAPGHSHCGATQLVSHLNPKSPGPHAAGIAHMRGVLSQAVTTTGECPKDCFN